MTESTPVQPGFESSSDAPAPENAFSVEMAEATASDKPITPTEYNLIIDENVVEKIASKSAQKIDGIIDMKGNLFSTIQEGLGGSNKTKGVSADVVDEGRARVNLDIILEYGKSAPEVFEKIKEVVGGDLENMTGLALAEMTVNVVDVMTLGEYNDKRGTGTNGGVEQSAEPYN